MADLPIDIVPQTNPPVFRWRQVVDTFSGCHAVEHMETLPPTIETALTALIVLTKQLLRDNASLRDHIKPPQSQPKKAKG